MEVYQEQLEELEIVVLESKVLGSVVVMGDFNGHLGILAGVRGQGGPNMHCYCCYGSGFTLGCLGVKWKYSVSTHTSLLFFHSVCHCVNWQRKS